jgi:hypothetical protein
VIFFPLPREMLLSALVDGKVDLVAAQVPLTPSWLSMLPSAILPG